MAPTDKWFFRVTCDSLIDVSTSRVPTCIEVDNGIIFTMEFLRRGFSNRGALACNNAGYGEGTPFPFWWACEIPNNWSRRPINVPETFCHIWYYNIRTSLKNN